MTLWYVVMSHRPDASRWAACRVVATRTHGRGHATLLVEATVAAIAAIRATSGVVLVEAALDGPFSADDGRTYEIFGQGSRWRA